MKLTEREKKVMLGIANSEYNDGGNQAIWSWSIRAVGIGKRSVPGVVASLVKKGLAVCWSGETKKEDTVALTDAGIEVLKSIATDYKGTWNEKAEA